MIDILKKSDHTRLMVKNDCQQILYLNAADSKSGVKQWQVKPILPVKRKSEDGGGQSSVKK